ncbi:2-isopropylmalate synthase [Ferrithrix thermotolerans DSM 19514]|uniref:Citramalate synthase n=1 Tax=Ferrithrix thermotolerans DSM 19514 TaxID=1121881 RepID=A0A1M4TW88_9ACTN|nr:citramalate synthase [Ferrithrix thermotolerans]SHE48718.1 2-isopropylmalate synthase [Ferrithrix thermotolerans DSM 19514]
MSSEHVAGLPSSVDVYDTTLRDGAQQEGISLTVEDKLRVARQLDALGVRYIEGGWPGANPKDAEFFRRAPEELNLEHATLVAFGSTRRAGVKAESDATLRSLLEASTKAVCLVAKAWDYHVTDALRTSLGEGIKMAFDSVDFLVKQGLEVFFDAEHFFDGYKRNPSYSLSILDAAEQAGARTLVLCDTNGGALPFEVEEIVARVSEVSAAQIGVHFHNDSGCAVANSLSAVRAGATHVQGCINGYGERTGNANLSTVVPDLTLKMGIETVPRERIQLITSLSRHVAEIVNLPLSPQSPYVGASAFTHKAGLHVSAIARRPDAYEHIDPETVGNGTRFVVSEMAGRQSLLLKANELGVEIRDEALSQVLERLKELEHKGYHFEVADGSLELLLRLSEGWTQDFFSLESFKVLTEYKEKGESVTEATVKVVVNGERVIETAEGNGPVSALDAALRKALRPYFEALSQMHLTDFKVRVLDSDKATDATVRVLIDSSNGDDTWSTIGVSSNVIEASWHALVDSIVVGLIRAAASSVYL